MTSVAAIPFGLEAAPDEVVLTFVVPAPNGCNLACPYCFISRRSEPAQLEAISPNDYSKFIHDVAEKEEIAAICIQGYEPLLPESLSFTYEILKTSQKLSIPSSIVTNGSHLDENIEKLFESGISKICVSLDASMPEWHDKLRGNIEGAFDDAIRGLRRANNAKLVNQTEISVASILIPKRRHLLEGMPSLLEELGVSVWVITNLQMISKSGVAEIVGDPATINKDLLILDRLAREKDISLLVDDEFGAINLSNAEIDQFELRVRRLINPKGVYRLLPNGQCLQGINILKKVDPSCPKWIPQKENAWSFLQQSE